MGEKSLILQLTTDSGRLSRLLSLSLLCTDPITWTANQSDSLTDEPLTVLHAQLAKSPVRRTVQCRLSDTCEGFFGTRPSSYFRLTRPGLCLNEWGEESLNFSCDKAQDWLLGGRAGYVPYNRHLWCNRLPVQNALAVTMSLLKIHILP